VPKLTPKESLHASLTWPHGSAVPARPFTRAIAPNWCARYLPRRVCRTSRWTPYITCLPACGQGARQSPRHHCAPGHCIRGRFTRSQREERRIHGPGIGDNSLGVAALLGLVWMLRDASAELGSDIWLVANACEEGLGDLRGMKAVVERFRDDARGYLVLEGTALGQVYHRAVGVQRIPRRITTTGGHSWSDYGNRRPCMKWHCWSVDSRDSTAESTAHNAQCRHDLRRKKIGVNILARTPSLNWMRARKAQRNCRHDRHHPGAISDARREGRTCGGPKSSAATRRRTAARSSLVQLALDWHSQQGLDGRATSGSTDATFR